MTEIAAQLVALYEEHEVTPIALARDFGYEEQAVRMVLLQNSKKYREQVEGKNGSKEEEEQLFSDDDMRNAAEHIRTLARDSESDVVRMKASEFIINEKKGRHDVVKALKDAPAMNILVLNQHFAVARNRIAEMKRVKGIENSAKEVIEESIKQVA